MKDFYAFPAVFHVSDDGISITFPDLPGCLPCANSMEEAFVNAREALQLHLYGMKEDNEPIPEPAAIKNIALGSDDTIAMIEAMRLSPASRETMQAIDDVNHHRGLSRKFSSVDELMEDLNKPIH